MVSQTMFIVQEGPVNALDLNRDANQIVVAGRNIFKIFSIEDTDFQEKLNLRVGRNLNLNFSCADVVWSNSDPAVLATAATNGAVVTWNVNKTSRSKQEMIYQDHKRTVNKVNFHHTDSTLLISGSQDGTIKLFDLRKKEVASTFYSNSESVRDVQFNPHQSTVFAAVQENGNIQVWDYRRTDKQEKQFTGHSGPVFACDWHPEERRWLATAGRDRTIKVWDVSNRSTQEYVIQTIASVARIKWRPQHRYHIASSSLVVDFSVNVWNLERPFIPYASFNEHKDVTTGITWRNDPNVILSVSKDCTLYQHNFKDAVRPAESANPVGLDFNCTGDVAFAASDKIVRSCLNGENGVIKNGASRLVSLLKKPVVVAPEQNRSACSVAQEFPALSWGVPSHRWFILCATKYLINGKCFSDVCEHNAKLAMDNRKEDIAKTWRMIKLFYASNAAAVLQSSGCVMLGRNHELWSGEHLNTMDYNDECQQGERLTSRHVSGSQRHYSGGETRQLTAGGDTSTGLSEDDTDTDELDHGRYLTDIAQRLISSQPAKSTVNHSDFFFGDGDLIDSSIYNFECGYVADEMLTNGDWTLPNEAFQPRLDIYAKSSPPSNDGGPINDVYDYPDAKTGFARGFVNQHDSGHQVASTDYSNQQIVVLSTQFSLNALLPSWDWADLIESTLRFYAEQGDVQTAVSVILAMGDKVKQIRGIDNQTLEHWFNSYVDLLGRYRLWNTANRVIKLCHLANVNSLNQQSTTVVTNCNHCAKQLHRTGWLCDRCKKLTNTCSLCHLVVRGLYSWCQGCSHGGHMQHMKQWFKENTYCPTGCGHKCEYS